MSFQAMQIIYKFVYIKVVFLLESSSTFHS